MKHCRVVLFLALGVWGANGQTPASCTLKGRVVNAVTGEPLAKAQVTLRDNSSGNSYTTAVDETGSFTVTGAQPAEYELLVRKRGFVPGGKTANLQGTGAANGAATQAACPPLAPDDYMLRLMPQGVMTGRVVDGEGEPIAGVAVQALAVRGFANTRRYSVAATATTNDLGEYRIFGLMPGRYFLGAAYRSEAGYGAVYYPGIEEAARALPLDVRPGTETAGLNLTIERIHSTSIRGVLTGPTGLATRGLMIVAAPCDAGPLNRSTTTVRGTDGAFTLRDLTPGCYVLAADTFVGGKRFSARMPVTVADSNIQGVHLGLVPPVQLAGRIQTEDANGLQLHQVVINIEARASKLTAGGGAREDGAFILDNVVPETYDLSVAMPDGYYLKSATMGNIDVLRAGIDLSRGAEQPLALIISGAGGAVDGTVVGDQEKPQANARVVVIPDATDGAARPKIAVADAQGHFQIRGIAPGKYRLYGAQDLDVTAIMDPSYSREIENQGLPISVEPNSRETITLKALAAFSVAAGSGN